MKPPASPFFAPSTPRKLIQISTPGGTTRKIKKESTKAKEHKSSVAGATSNLVNAIIGAGIVGIPFAIKECGLIAGIILVLLCALLTEKSLRVLIDTAKHVDVPSYETLFESTYGSFGFYFISINMLIMAYGGCLSYLTIIKDTLPVLLGVSSEDVGMARAILVVSTMAIILPISMQRDMADLAKTSKVSVIFQCAMVAVVVVFSPVSESIEANGGLVQIAAESVVNWNKIFIGLGVLSFAFVCQHGAFIVAGSLEKPTKERWAMATSRALSLCVILEAACGIAGYLAFLEETQGDILNNFLSLGGNITKAANIARGLLCTTMFFVYPMDSFICRHVFVVLFFRGRRAHEGDDASVLNRRDRRIAMTLIIYFSSLIPALFVESVGSVLAITGTIAGSCLSYIGPGMIYLAVYGDEFLTKVQEVWGEEMVKGGNNSAVTGQTTTYRDVESSRLLTTTTTLQQPSNATTTAESSNSSPEQQSIFKSISWYLLLMPIWCEVAKMGKTKLQEFKEKEALKSPHINRLGKCAPPSIPMMNMPRVNSSDAPRFPTPKYGATAGGNKAIGAALLAQQRAGAAGRRPTLDSMPTDVDEPPTWYDFCIAIFFVGFGMIALCAGLFSILTDY